MHLSARWRYSRVHTTGYLHMYTWYSALRRGFRSQDIMWTIATAAAAVIAAVQTVEEVAPLNALDKYVSTPDPNFHWFDTGARVKPTLSSATAHILNVTSQQWLTEAQAIGPNGALWSKCARGIRT